MHSKRTKTGLDANFEMSHRGLLFNSNLHFPIHTEQHVLVEHESHRGSKN
jgi:hypothetical protein